MTLLQSCYRWAGGCGSSSENLESVSKLSSTRLPCSVLVASSAVCLMPNILHMQYSHSLPFCPTEACRKPLSEKDKFHLFSPKVSSNWTQNISEVAEIRHERAGIYMKRQKGHLPVYYSHKTPTKTLFLHEKKSVPALWASRLSVGRSSLLT